MALPVCRTVSAPGWAMASDGVDEVRLAGVFAAMRPVLDERQWRRLLGAEARARGHGGIASVARASGAAESTVAAGVRELERADCGEGPLTPGRSRRSGGGRKKAEDKDAGLRPALLELVEASTRGDPVSPLRWTTLSLRDLERQLAVRGHPCGKDTVARILAGEGYSLQAHARVTEGKQHADRDAQFRHIAAVTGEYLAAGDPVISVDGKKKERLGEFGRAGRVWRPKGDPVRVRDHDWEDLAVGCAVPYGIYDIAADTGFVVVGNSHETTAFAAGSVRRWWLAEGSLRYPGAGRLLVTCDAGGSNGVRFWGWKDGLARLAEETGLEIAVCHFPPGTSKWNKIEHRLFCHITRTWRGRPLETLDEAVAGIAATVTSQGLKCTAVRDDADYPLGQNPSGQRRCYLEDHLLARHDFRGEWNYAALP